MKRERDSENAFNFTVMASLPVTIQVWAENTEEALRLAKEGNFNRVKDEDFITAMNRASFDLGTVCAVDEE